MTEATPITVAYGDGIGPEIMEATLHILKEAEANISIETIEVGKKIYEQGEPTGIPQSAWDSLERTKVLLKAPITTPQGGGYKSLNVTMRKRLGLYSNVRPCISYHPFIKTHHPNMNMVIVRENEEDLYAGIEYRLSEDAIHSIKLITQSGSERIIRFAFEYAKRYGRRKITCMSKDNIMKLTDGMFSRIFREVAEEYPDIESEHYIIDIGAARIANAPWRFDVIVTENLYGDIISDIAAEISGSVGLAGSSNIGSNVAMFEAIHGSAPDISGQNIANPSGLLRGAIMMLVHIGQAEVATRIENAWLRTLEDGMHTADIYGINSKEKLGTQEFAKAVIERLGQKPEKLKEVEYKPTSGEGITIPPLVHKKASKRELIGIDIYIDWDGEIEALGERISKITSGGLKLNNISSKGLKVWPNYVPGMNITDQYRCRFLTEDSAPVEQDNIMDLIQAVHKEGTNILKTENLYTFDGQLGYSKGQGE